MTDSPDTTSAGASSAAANGRDVFVAGAASPASLGAMLEAAFGLPAATVVLPDSSDAHWLASLARPCRVVIHVLEPDGDFAYKVDLDFDRPIDTGRLAALARDRGLTIAWAVDETSPRDDYQVAFPDGTLAVHPLRFRETEESYACLLLPACPAPPQPLA